MQLFVRMQKKNEKYIYIYQKLKPFLHITSQFVYERCKERDRERMRKRQTYIYVKHVHINKYPIIYPSILHAHKYVDRKYQESSIIKS